MTEESNVLQLCLASDGYMAFADSKSLIKLQVEKYFFLMSPIRILK